MYYNIIYLNIKVENSLTLVNSEINKFKNFKKFKKTQTQQRKNLKPTRLN